MMGRIVTGRQQIPTIVVNAPILMILTPENTHNAIYQGKHDDGSYFFGSVIL